MSGWHGGKGSKQRPTDKNKFDANWDAIFGKKEKDEQLPCVAQSGSASGLGPEGREFESLHTDQGPL